MNASPTSPDPAQTPVPDHPGSRSGGTTTPSRNELVQEDPNSWPEEFRAAMAVFLEDPDSTESRVALAGRVPRTEHHRAQAAAAISRVAPDPDLVVHKLL